MDQSLSWAILSSLFMWTTLYNVICLMNPQRSYEWNCRIVTFIHAILMVTMSGFFGLFYNPWPFTHPGGKTNFYENLTMILCVGYFIFDLFWSFYFFDKETMFMILHHFVTIIGIFGSLYTQRSGTEVNASILGSELSNPMLQIRWFMRQIGKKYTFVYELNDLVFMCTFILCRMFVGTYLMYCEWSHPDPTLFFKIGALSLWLVSLVFALQITNFAIFKYTKMYRAWKNTQTSVSHVRDHSNSCGSVKNGVANNIMGNGNIADSQQEAVIRTRFMQNGIHANQVAN